jgi:tellurite resistance protein TerA
MSLSLKKQPATSNSWYDNKVVVIILLFLFFPVGLYAMWKNKKFSDKTKWIVSGFFSILVLISVFSKEKQTTSMSSSGLRTPVVSVPAEAPEQVEKSKVILKKQGDSVQISLKKKEFSTIHVKLDWTKGVDLDLHAFYKTKSGEFGHIYFGDEGNLDKEPYIMLDKDAGVGSTAGNNEENLKIGNLNNFSSIVIATNIFRFFGFLNKDDNFAKYDGKVVVQTDTGDNVMVPLISEEKGRWCIIAKIDNSGEIPLVININKVQKDKPRPDAL